MSTSVIFNNTTYAIPEVGDKRWGQAVSNFLISVAGNSLSKAGGTFTLTADADFGSNFGLKALYLITKSINPAQSGVVRLSNTDKIAFRNAANNADLVLGVNASDVLEFAGVAIPVAASTVTLTGTQTLTNKTLTAPVINSPTGIVKADVGLSSVDNTSDATKNAASVTLTNKTLTSPVLNTPTTSGEIVANYTDYTQVATPASPGAGVSRIYAKNDAKLYQVDNSGVEKQLGGGGLSPVAVSANVTLAVINTMYLATSTGGFTITLPTIPASGGAIGVMDAGETCSATNFVRITPATGQSIDGYVTNDSALLDYVRANAVFYAAPGATSWKVQYQTTSMVQGGQLPASSGATQIAAGYAGSYLSSTPAAGTGTTGSTTANTWTAVAGLSLTLTPGEWDINAMQSVYLAGGNGTSPNFRIGYSRVYDVTTSSVLQAIYAGTADASKAFDISQAHHSLRVTVAPGTTKQVRVEVSSNENNSPTTISGLQGAYSGSGYIKAEMK